jgi:hypothetical protein
VPPKMLHAPWVIKLPLDDKVQVVEANENPEPVNVTIVPTRPEDGVRTICGPVTMNVASTKSLDAQLPEQPEPVTRTE